MYCIASTDLHPKPETLTWIKFIASYRAPAIRQTGPAKTYTVRAHARAHTLFGGGCKLSPVLLSPRGRCQDPGHIRHPREDHLLRAQVPGRAEVPGGGDADDEHDRRGRHRQAVHHEAQRPQHGTVHACPPPAFPPPGGCVCQHIAP